MVGINLIVGFNFGISGYLYGFALVRAISLVLNIVYAGKELKTPFMWFLKPMVPFIFLSVLLVVGITGIQEYIEQGSYFIDLIINGSLYTALFLGITYFLKLPGLKDILTLVPWNRNK
jgi:O-antigen/teichoic acid export membrane protein